MKRNRLISGLISAAALVAASVVPAAAEWPERAVTFIVGYPAGGTTDIVARLVANELQGKLGQPVVVENRPGAAGQTGTTAVAQSEADGHTLLFTIGSHTILPAVNADLPYDAVASFEPVAMVGTSPNMILVKSDDEIKTLEDYINAAKADPGELDYGTPGVGTTTHVTAAMLEQKAGISLSHIPYKGSGPTSQALMAGEIRSALGSIISAGPMVRDGRFHAVAIVGDERSPLLPDVPTFKEQGYDGILGNNWLGLMAPAKTPSDVVTKLAGVIEELVTSAEFQKKLAEQGVQAEFMNPETFKKVMDDEVAAYKELATQVNLKSE